MKKWIVVLLVVTMTSCSPFGANHENKQNFTDDTQQNHQGNETLKERSPLTGLEVTEKSLQRSFAAIINNDPHARPQEGLAEADIVYEILAEGTITRFLAIYQSQLPSRIGPVRSARDYLVKLATGYDSILILHGYSPQAKAILENQKIDNLNGLFYDGTLFQRTSDRIAPHNSFISSTKILSGIEKKHYNINAIPKANAFLQSGDVQTLPGMNGLTITIRPSNSKPFESNYVYDVATSQYIRNIVGTTGSYKGVTKTVYAENVFIVEANHSVTSVKDRRIIDIESGGNAYLFQRGVKYNVQWKNIQNRILPYVGNTPVSFVPGKTWIHVVENLENTVSSE